MAAFKAGAILPAAIDSRGWLVPLGAALCASALLAGREKKRSEDALPAVPVLVLAIAAAGPFFAIGVSGPVTRYVTVPAAIATVLLGGLIGWIACESLRRHGIERAFGVAGAVLLVFWVARHGVAKAAQVRTYGRSGVSRSLIRDLCRRELFHSGDLVIAAPDMLGPTLHYYLPPGVALRGFVHWEEPALADFGDYWTRWPDRREVTSAISKLDRDVASESVRRVLLVYAVGNDNPLPFRKRTAELRQAIAAKYKVESTAVYRGPSDVIQVDVFAP